MSSPLEKVLKLIALTSSSFEEEARSSALKACQLIRKYGFIVTEAGGKRKRRYDESFKERVRHDGEWYSTNSPAGDQEIIARAASAGQCSECHAFYATGARIVKQQGEWVHLRCWRHE